MWVSFECDEEYDEDDPHVWIECDTCRERYHSDCSSIKYKTIMYVKSDDYVLCL